jgi:hypothetical protein
LLVHRCLAPYGQHLVPRVGFAPTSPGLQAGAWSRSATEERCGGVRGTRVWRKRQDSDLRSPRGSGLATRCNRPLCHASVEEGPALVVARAKPWDWALRRRRPSFYCERWTMVDAAGLAPAFSCLRGRRLPARLHARLVHEAGFDPPPPGSEPGALPVAPLVSLEEGVRFGLTSPQGDPVFETGALSRSATLPSPGAAGPAPEPPHTLARTTGVAPATFRSTAGCSAFELRPQHAG